MKALQDWQPLYQAEGAILDEIGRLPQTTVVSVDMEWGRVVVAVEDGTVQSKKEAP